MLEAFSFILTAKGLDEQHNAIIIKKLRISLKDLSLQAQADLPVFYWDAIPELLHELEHGDSTIEDFESSLSF